jgi:hypothetical protein
VKYSEDVRDKAGWMFEADIGQEALPDLANPENPQMNLQVQEKPQMVKKPTIKKKVEIVVEDKTPKTSENTAPEIK